MFEVRIFVETTYTGPARRDGVAMWLVEYMRQNGEPVTRYGSIRTENGTENQATLEAIIAALRILQKKCSVRVFTQCEHILAAVRNGWCEQWQQAEWTNAKGKPVKNADLWNNLLEEMEKHDVTFETGPHEYRNLMQSDARRELDRWKGMKKRTV